MRPSRTVTTMLTRSPLRPVTSTTSFSPPSITSSSAVTTPSSCRARSVSRILSGSWQSPGIGSHHSHCAPGSSISRSASKSPRRNASKPRRTNAALSVLIGRAWRHGPVRTLRPPASGGPLQRSVAASLASILEVDVADVPLPEDGHPEPFTVWKNWLAQRGLGLVPIADPARFNWPGPWLALLHSGDGEIGAVAFGSPPGVAWNPLGTDEPFETVQRGFV